jgi:VanZ family protein
MQYASPRPRLVLVLAAAALLEAAQVLQPVHTPSTTDVLTVYGGALAGAYLVDRSPAVSRTAGGSPAPRPR